MQEAELIQKLTSLEDRTKSNTHRIDGLDEKVEDIHELATSVKLLASETKAMREDVNDMNNRLKTVEQKPVNNWDKIVTTAIGTIVGAIVGAVIGLILK